MTDGNADNKPAQGGRPKWYVPVAFAVAFTLSFVLAEVMGPVGAVIGLGGGAALGWAGAKWLFPGKEGSQ